MRILLTVGLLISLGMKAQTATDFFNPGKYEMVWLGIDFSHVQLVGEFAQFFGAGEKSPQQLTDTYFPAWNELILKEYDKYDIEGLVRCKVNYDITLISSKNEQAKTGDMEAVKPQMYKEGDIKRFIAEYDIENRDAIGLLFLVESFNKTNKQAFVHFVVLNMRTRKYLFSSRILCEPQGFGIRNYWAGAIYDAIKEGKHRYKSWKSMFSE